MKKIQNKKGFTLIELLVVITIIGILATGWVTVYSSQLQKARDTTRLNDIESVKSFIEQSAQDNWSYPTALTFNTTVPTYWTIPKDTKTWLLCAGTTALKTNCWYAYKVADDTSWVTFQLFNLSTGFENSNNVKSKSANDKWSDAIRYEVWVSTNTINPGLSAATVVPISSAATNTWARLPDWWAATTAYQTVVLFWK